MELLTGLFFCSVGMRGKQRAGATKRPFILPSLPLFKNVPGRCNAYQNAASLCTPTVKQWGFEKGHWTRLEVFKYMNAILDRNATRANGLISVIIYNHLLGGWWLSYPPWGISVDCLQNTQICHSFICPQVLTGYETVPILYRCLSMTYISTTRSHSQKISIFLYS